MNLLKQEIDSESSDRLEHDEYFDSFQHLHTFINRINVHVKPLNEILPCRLSIKTWCYDEGSFHFLHEAKDSKTLEKLLLDLCFGH